MDAHYDSQIQANTHTTFSGPARQIGSGGGIGAFAVPMDRVAIPLVRKYILPIAKQVSKNLIESAVLELGQILTGKKQPRRKLLTNVAKRAAIETEDKLAERSCRSARRRRRAETRTAAIGGEDKGRSYPKRQTIIGQ